ncbi:membrane protein [Cryobacterium sp. MLB-32]|uniref:SHOCT domain-containing protein n=1 Tax=Cryobacterium sp. MLB-32 TaxID=1529318 RepID=UPI0004E62CDE|nr:SHOCT domain-containing protein [Cryobacterium sp. MLB-32]KFF59962.1 membrane protein [Cryobacterium sp. MLB-32]
MMWGYGGNVGGMWLLGVLTLVGIALLVVLLVRVFGGNATGGDPRRDGGTSEANLPAAPVRSRALQILDERFASGEITADQYREQVRILGEGR